MDSSVTEMRKNLFIKVLRLRLWIQRGRMGWIIRLGMTDKIELMGVNLTSF